MRSTAQLEATELIAPRSTIDGSSPVPRQTEHWFFDLPAFTDRLLNYLDQHAHHWRPSVVNFARNFIRNGLQGRPITRDLDWGVAVPLPGWEHHDKCLYVWFEALIGYVSASIEWAQNTDQPDAWKLWWHDPHARIYNFLGKDNIPFHTIIWPAQLLGVDHLDDSSTPLNLPFDIPANALLTFEQAQFSKSRGHAVWLHDLLEQYDPDVIRYYVASVLPEYDDSDFSWSEFIRRTNDELIAAWGNLVHRVLTFAVKHWDGKTPKPGVLSPLDQALMDQIAAGFANVGEHLEAVQLRAALRETMGLVRAVNAYLTQAPWFSVIRDNKAIAATTVFTALRAIDSLKVLLASFLPFSAERVHQALGYTTPLFGSQQIATYPEMKRSHDVLVYDAALASGAWRPSALVPDQRITWSRPLYTRLEAVEV